MTNKTWLHVNEFGNKIRVLTLPSSISLKWSVLFSWQYIYKGNIMKELCNFYSLQSNKRPSTIRCHHIQQNWKTIYHWHTNLWHINNFTHSLAVSVGQWILTILPFHWVWDTITIFTSFVQVKFSFSILNLILSNMEPRSPSKGKMVKNVTKQLGRFDRTHSRKGGRRHLMPVTFARSGTNL